jgi:hypothetical protein
MQQRDRLDLALEKQRVQPRPRRQPLEPYALGHVERTASAFKVHQVISCQGTPYSCCRSPFASTDRVVW